MILRPFQLWEVGSQAHNIRKLNQISSTHFSGKVEGRGVSGSEIPLKSLPKYFSHHSYLPSLLGMKRLLPASLPCGDPTPNWYWLNVGLHGTARCSVAVPQDVNFNYVSTYKISVSLPFQFVFLQQPRPSS